MKILLIYPGTKTEANHTPVGLLRLAAILNRADYEVWICNYSGENISSSIVSKDIKKASLIGIYTITNPQLVRAAQISRMAKSKNIPVLWGGPHATVLPEISFQQEYVDYLITGEADESLPLFCAAFKNQDDMKEVPGLWYLRSGEICRNASPVPPDITELPSIDWNFLDGRKVRTSDPYSLSATFSNAFIEVSRGCQNACSFCTRPRLYGKGVRYRNVGQIIEEIRSLQSLFPHIKNIYLVANDIASNKEHAVSLFRALKQEKTNLSFTCDARVDTIDAEILEAMREAGIRRIHYGIESGSQKILKLLNKGTSHQKMLSTFALTQKFRIETLAFFIYSIPTENFKDLLQTVHFSWKLRADHYIFQILKPMLGSKLYPLAFKPGRKEPRTLEDWAWLNYTRYINFTRIPRIFYLVTFKLFRLFHGLRRRQNSRILRKR